MEIVGDSFFVEGSSLQSDWIKRAHAGVFTNSRPILYQLGPVRRKKVFLCVLVFWAVVALATIVSKQKDESELERKHGRRI